MMDHDELAARSAIVCWQGKEGRFSKILQEMDIWSLPDMEAWLTQWMLARSVPRSHRSGLLEFINAFAIPRFKLLTDISSKTHHGLVEEFSVTVLQRGILKKRSLSFFSKFAFSLHPELFIPYDSRVRNALKKHGCKVMPNSYASYVALVLNRKPAFVATLKEKNLTLKSLNAQGVMSQALFELRALDKRLMLEGGFNPTRMMKDLRGLNAQSAEVQP